MNFGIAFLGDRSTYSEPASKENRVSALGAALEAYFFLLRHFWSALRLLLIPIVAAGVALYIALNRYLTELISFLDTPNPRIASLALGALAAGLFLSLFCYAIAVSAICDLALGKPGKKVWMRVKADRQEWRIYAAYMRLLLLLSIVMAVASILSNFLVPRILMPVSLFSWVLVLGGGVGIIWLFARIGFLVAPVVAVSEGAVLRKAFDQSAGDFWRNSLLLALLLIPGVLLLIAGGYAFQMKAGGLRIDGASPLVDSARSMKGMLGAFVSVITLASFVTIALLTVGAIAVYQTKRFRQVWGGSAAEVEGRPSLGCSAPDETLPE